MTDIDDVLLAATMRAEALASGDEVALHSLLHPDFRWTTYRGEVLDRVAYVSGNTGTGLSWHSQRLFGPRVVVVGDTAVLTAEVLDEVEADQGRETFRLRLTQTWVRSNGQWICLSGHAGPRLSDEG